MLFQIGQVHSFRSLNVTVTIYSCTLRQLVRKNCPTQTLMVFKNLRVGLLELESYTSQSFLCPFCTQLDVAKAVVLALEIGLKSAFVYGPASLNFFVALVFMMIWFLGG